MRGGPDSIAPRAAHAGLLRPHFMLKGPGGPEERSAPGFHQPTHVGHRIRGLSAAGGLGTLLDVEGLDKGGGGAHYSPPTETPHPASKTSVRLGFLPTLPRLQRAKDPP